MDIEAQKSLRPSIALTWLDYLTCIYAAVCSYWFGVSLDVYVGWAVYCYFCAVLFLCCFVGINVFINWSIQHISLTKNCPSVQVHKYDSRWAQTWFIIVVNVDTGWTCVWDCDDTFEHHRPASLSSIQLYTRKGNTGITPAGRIVNIRRYLVN